MTRYILAALIGVCIGMHINLWQHDDFRAHANAVARRWISASDYVARAVTEQGLPWRGYRQGFRDGQAAMLRVQLRDVKTHE